MESGNLDVFAIGRALAIGFVIAAIVYFVTRTRAEWLRWRAVGLMGAVGVTILLLFLWPRLITVPTLDGLSQAEAEDKLRSYHLVAQSRPQYAQVADAGRVIARSQNPSAGISVRRGTVVSFAVGERGETPPDNPANGMAISFFKPRAGEKVSCSRGADGIYKLSAEGTSSGVSTATHDLLFWVRPVNPPADRIGWYLQRPPSNGVTLRADGSWTAVAQIGNAQFPPHEGDTVDLAVTIAEKTAIAKLKAELGVVVLDQPLGGKSAAVSPVTLTLR